MVVSQGLTLAYVKTNKQTKNKGQFRGREIKYDRYLSNPRNSNAALAQKRGLFSLGPSPKCFQRVEGNVNSIERLH